MTISFDTGGGTESIDPNQRPDGGISSDDPISSPNEKLSFPKGIQKWGGRLMRAVGSLPLLAVGVPGSIVAGVVGSIALRDKSALAGIPKMIVGQTAELIWHGAESTRGWGVPKGEKQETFRSIDTSSDLGASSTPTRDDLRAMLADSSVRKLSPNDEAWILNGIVTDTVGDRILIVNDDNQLVALYTVHPDKYAKTPINPPAQLLGDRDDPDDPLRLGGTDDTIRSTDSQQESSSSSTVTDVKSQISELRGLQPQHEKILYKLAAAGRLYVVLDFESPPPIPAGLSPGDLFLAAFNPQYGTVQYSLAIADGVAGCKADDDTITEPDPTEFAKQIHKQVQERIGGGEDDPNLIQSSSSNPEHDLLQTLEEYEREHPLQSSSSTSTTRSLEKSSDDLLETLEEYEKEHPLRSSSSSSTKPLPKPAKTGHAGIDNLIDEGLAFPSKKLSGGKYHITNLGPGSHFIAFSTPAGRDPQVDALCTVGSDGKTITYAFTSAVDSSSELTPEQAISQARRK